jgi:hypothetical protein
MDGWIKSGSLSRLCCLPVPHAADPALEVMKQCVGGAEADMSPLIKCMDWSMWTRVGVESDLTLHVTPPAAQAAAQPGPPGVTSDSESVPHWEGSPSSRLSRCRGIMCARCRPFTVPGHRFHSMTLQVSHREHHDDIS